MNALREILRRLFDPFDVVRLRQEAADKQRAATFAAGYRCGQNDVMWRLDIKCPPLADWQITEAHFAIAEGFTSPSAYLAANGSGLQ